MAARTITNWRDRLATIMIAPLMTCSARLPVYALIIGAFIPRTTVAGVFNLQGLVLFGLYVAGVVERHGRGRRAQADRRQGECSIR
jgi:ferrous iron transport protein B